MIEIVVEGPETILVEKMKRARWKDEKIVKVVEEIKKAGVRALRCDKWKIERDLVLKESKVYISKNRASNKELLVARSDKKCWEIHRGVWFMSEDEK